MTSELRDTSAGGGAQSGVADEMKNDAGRLKDSLGARAKQEAESRKGQAAHVAGSASSALNTAAEDLRANPEVPDWMATALQQAARKIESLAGQIEGRSVDQLGQDVTEFARRNPGTFLAASAAVGFAATRVLRAGVDKKRHDRADEQSSQDYPADEQSWVADENMMPTETGSFAPAYASDNQTPGGGAI
jgi:hypothetical protein